MKEHIKLSSSVQICLLFKILIGQNKTVPNKDPQQKKDKETQFLKYQIG